MAELTTAKGVPYVDSSDDLNVYPGRMQDLANWIDARPGVESVSTTGRAGLTGADLWLGRVIANSDTHGLETYDGAAWHSVGTLRVPGERNPQLLYNSTGLKYLDGWTVLSGGSWTSATNSNTNPGVPVSRYFLTNGNSGGAVQLASPYYQVAASGLWYTLSGWLLNAAGASGVATISLDCYNGATFLSSVAILSLAAGSGWTYLSAAGQMPANTTQIRVVQTGHEGSSGNPSIAFGRIKLEQGQYATEWSDDAAAPGWTAYVPVIGGTGWALGNGTVAGAYRCIDLKTVAIRLKFIIGSTTTNGSGDLTLSLPPGMTSNDYENIFGFVSNAGVGTVEAYAQAQNASQFTLWAPNPSASVPNVNTLNSGHYSLASGSVISFNGVMEIQ